MVVVRRVSSAVQSGPSRRGRRRPSLQTCGAGAATPMSAGAAGAARRRRAMATRRRARSMHRAATMADSANSISSTRYFTRPVRRAALGVGDDCALLAPAPGHAAGRVDRHAGRGPPLPVDGRARAARPQGAGGQPERPGRLRRAAAGLHAGARAAARSTRPCSPASRAACSRWPTRTAASWSAATPRAARSTSASPCSARCRPARRCCARARAPATTSGSAARSATRGWRSRCSAARVALAATAFDARAPRDGAAEPRVALGLALRGIATSAIDVCDGLRRRPRPRARAAPASAPSSTSTRCRAARVLAAQPRRRCSANACSPAATTTSWSSPRRPTARDAVAAAARARRRRR